MFSLNQVPKRAKSYLLAHRLGLHNTSLQQEALQASLGFLSTIDDSTHWFCNDECRMVVVEAMFLFSFPDSEALSWLQASIEKSLQRCYQCAEKYQVTVKNELRHIATEVYGYTSENVTDYFAKITGWDQNRLLTSFQDTLDRAKAQSKELCDQKGPGFEARTLCGLFECLWCPSLCDKVEFMEIFQKIFIGIQAGGKLLRVAGSVLPAMYTFAFSPDRRLRDWSRKCFDKMKGQVSTAQFKIAGKDEVLKACQNLKDTQLSSSPFWAGLQCILRFTDPTGVSAELRDADISVMDLISGEISSHSSHLQGVSQCLNLLLPAMGSNAWLTCPIPAQEFGPKILNNPKFMDLLAHPESLVSNSSTAEPLNDCLYWIRPYILSQFGGNKYRVATQFLHFLTDPSKQDTLPSVSQIACKLQAMKLLQALLRDLANNSDKDAKRSFQIEFRTLVDSFATIVADLAFTTQFAKQEWSLTRSCAIDVLMLTVQLDCDLLWQDYVSLSTTDFWASKDKKYSVPNSSLIWSIVSKNTRETNIDMLQRFVEIIGRKISLIDTIEIQSHMARELKVSVEVFNKTLNSAIGISNAVVRDIGGLWSSRQLKSFLARAQTNEGIIALMFSPNHETYQETLNLLKEAHEADGRLEALRSSFFTNFASTAQAFIHVANSWSTEGIFKSAVRVVRTASNILDVLFSSRNGLVSTSELTNLPEAMFQKLWQSLWRMLETAYRMALPWADRFNKEDLIEFMRDVLECSDLLLKQISAFEKAITGSAADQKTDISPEKQKELDTSLLNECLKAVKSLTTWLRLNNEDLLQSCVNLVCDILKRLASAEIRISDDTVYVFDRLIVNSKKHKNCLTEAQRTEIYIALCDHTDSAEDPDDVQVISSDQMPKKAGSVVKPTASVYDQMQLAAARKAASSPLEKQRLPNISTKPSTRPSLPIPVSKKPMTPEERAEFLRKRSGALPSALQSKKPVAKNASAGAIKKVDSSDSDSGSDEDIEGLFTSSTSKSPIKRRIEKRQTQKLEASGVQIVRRDPRLERNRIEQNLRARTNPDLTELHMRILAWDPIHDGTLPPDTDKKSYAKLIDSYQTADRYKKAVEPLFLLETWQHVVSSRENIKDKDKFEIILQTRSAVDNFVDLVATMSQTDWKKQIITDPDLLMLSTSPNFKPGAEASADYCMAKVQSIYKKKDIVEVGLRTVPSANMVKHLRPTVRLYTVKLSGLTPIHREYATLKALPYYDLCDEIVMGRPTKASALHETEVAKIMKAYGVNEPQAKAIDAALNNTGFTLIQGPPGTGKTKTILGMVGAFLSVSKLQGNAINLPGQRQQAKKEEIKKKKILLCAPSNAAVDEIVLRLKNGILTDKGESYIPKIVRMGMSDAININVQDVTLDALLDDMLNRADDKMKGNHNNDPAELREKLNATLKERDVQRALLEKARNDNRDSQAIENEIKKLNNRKSQLGEQLDELRDKQSQKARAKDIERKKFQTQILADADVICATLSGSGHDLMASIAVDFETVIIDEACQTTELSALIPLKYGCTRCVMVGDPNQLPPTVLSTEAVSYAYNESLFVRMQRNSPNSVRLLAIQYRMHSSISRFPSLRFYNGNLLDGPEVDIYTQRAWHNSTVFGTYRFFDVKGREEESNKHSVYNLAEAKTALAIVRRLKDDFFDVDFDGRIGIVTPYKEQHNQIRKMFQQQFGQSVLSMIDFNTVDGFQGQEKDIIIFSCVRANEKRGIGFLSDVRRMNVGLTRAKCSVFILGHSGALKGNETWRALVEDAQARNLFTEVNSSTFSKSVRLVQRSPHASKIQADITNRKREASPTPMIKEEVKKHKSAPEFDDTRAPPETIHQKKSAIFNTFGRQDKPQTVKEDGSIANHAKGAAEHIDVDANTNKVRRSSGAEPVVKESPIMHKSITENDTKVSDHVDRAVKHEAPPPVKKKQETSLFIKRKKPGK